MRILFGAAHCTSPVGDGVEASFRRMREEGSALRTVPDAFGTGTSPWLGRFHDPAFHSTDRVFQAVRRCVDGTLAEARIDAADPRCAVVISTTKGDLDPLEAGDAAASRLPLLGAAIAQHVGSSASPWIISNACASGASALIFAADLIHAGEADHALVIGVDVLSRFVLSGFGALHALSAGPCRPYDDARDGITLGEAAVSLFLSRDRAVFDRPLGEYLGGGVANDANHISGPSRTGEGLMRAVNAALESASIRPDEVHAINAHGTGTEYNDAMEAQAFGRCGLQHVPLASYKGYFGHTLGAAGLLEAVIASHALREGLHLRSEGTRRTSLPLNVVLEHTPAEGDLLLKTSSGFGGTNAALLLRTWTD